MRKLFLIMMALIACSWSAIAQTRTYHGTVLEADSNEPLIGATVLPIGGGQGVATDIDGKFTINVPSNVHQIQVSYVGYTTVKVDLSDNMTIKLKSSSTNLDDVVVVAYGTASKESLTGSVAVVNSEEIGKRPVTSVTAALEGNAPGVQVYNSTGSPGSNPSILIRGINTVNGVTSPLYVVDGVVFTGGMADLNPNDVESISVLKDAASCALYGAKGANGVILVTTKRAKNVGVVDVTLSVKQGMYTRGLPFYDRVSLNEYMETALQAGVYGRMSGNASLSKADATAEAIKAFYSDNNVYNIYGKDPTEIFDSNGKMRAGVKPLPGFTDLDWWDAMSRTGYRQEYNLNATAAGQKYNVFTSISYLNEEGYTKNTGFERYNGRMNANYNPVDYFKFGANIMATYQSQNSNQFDMGSMSNPFAMVNVAPSLPYYQHDENSNIMRDNNGKPIWNTDAAYPQTRFNPGYLMEHDFEQYKGLMVDASIYGTAVLPYGFELTVKGNMWRDHGTTTSFSNPEVGDANGSIGGRLTLQTWRSYSHTFFQTLNWAHDYGMHHVDVLLDHENYSKSYVYDYVNNKGMIREGVYTLSNFSANESYGSDAYNVKTESYLGRVRYNYDQKYFGEASIRRDGTSRFAKDSRWGTFWSAGASWIISKEKFMENLTWIDYLKFRTAYGTVGSDAAAGYYAYWSLYDKIDYTPEGQVIYYPGQIAAADVKWESTNTLDVALEGNLFNNRLNFSVGYFLKDNADLLYKVSNPPSYASNWGGTTTTVLRNMGTMRNSGWEISIGGDIIRTPDFTWRANADATFIKNKVVKIPNHENVYGNPALIEGKSRYEIYTYDWVGVDRLTGRSLYAIEYEGAHEWEIRADDGFRWIWDDKEAKKLYDNNLKKAEAAGELVMIDGKPYTTNTSYATRKFFGSTLPTVYGSFGTSLSWKGINFGLLFTYSLGGKITDSGYSGLMGTMTSTSAHTFHKDILKSWTEAPAGVTEDSPFSQRVDTKGVPQANNTNQSNYNNAGSDRWLTSASYLTLKNINLSYDFPKAWTDAMKLKKLNLGVFIDNVFTTTSRKGINPLYNFSGGQGDTFVQARVFSFQLTAGF